MITDDTIKVVHTIKCFDCRKIFKNIGFWLDHVRLTEHSKQSHIVYYCVGENVSEVKVFERDV